MDSHSLDYEASTPEDSGYESGDNDDDCYQNARDDPDTRMPHNMSAAGGTLTSGDCVRQYRAAIRAMVLAAIPRSSRIPIHVTRARNQNTADRRSTPFDSIIQLVRNALDHPELSVFQQRVLCRALDRFEILQQANRYIQPQHVQPRTAPLPVYGPQPRPLSEAAIRQNTIARERAAALQRSGRQRNCRPADSDPPIRYNHAYDDLLGTRSLDDGSVLSYAIRHGEEYTYNARYTQINHNGYQFQRGHQYITSDDRYLVEIRQARSLAGLSTEGLDEELHYRVICDPDSWG